MTAHSLNKLTAKFVQNTKTPGRYNDGGGLYLVVATPTSRYWTFRFKWKGKDALTGLGAVGEIDLAEVRRVAQGKREILAQGLDPRVQHHKSAPVETSVPTFEEFGLRCIKDWKPGWRNEKSEHQWLRTVKVECKSFKDKPIDQIDTDMVLTVLRPMFLTKPESARRTRGRIEKILNAAKVAKLRSGENPAQWKGHLELLLRKNVAKVKEHYPAMPLEETRELVENLRARKNGASGPNALLFLILTACRTGEILGATKGEIDLENKMWVIPKERMKAFREHRVPLSKQAVELITPLMENHSDFLFPGLKGQLSRMSLIILMRKTNLKDGRECGQWVPHGFRSTFRDWAGDSTSYPRELAEAALAHIIGNQAEQAYRRGDALERRRQMMQDWADTIFNCS